MTSTVEFLVGSTPTSSSTGSPSSFIPSPSNPSDASGNSASSSPLLFFVALGFVCPISDDNVLINQGVLFTNLWFVHPETIYHLTYFLGSLSVLNIVFDILNGI